jgi:hypothetical protein
MTQPTGSLSRIASEMRRKISDATDGKTAATLPRGLRIVLERGDGEEWTLKLGREKVFPSQAEIAICMNAFSVPAGVEPRMRQALVEMPKTGRKAHYSIVEMAWREVPVGSGQ